MKVDLLCHTGSDLLVVNAARCSFDKESDWEYQEREEVDLDSRSVSTWKEPVGLKEKDVKLINFLAREKHVLPFRHPQVSFRIHAPIFVLRQLDKHQVGFSASEISRRYVDTGPEFYVPEVWRSRPEGSVKQGSGSEEVTALRVRGFTVQTVEEAYNVLLEHSKLLYTDMLAAGVSPEQARMVLPQSMYTTQVKTGSLLGWVQMIKLRTDAHAQKEIQDLANMISEHIQNLFPSSFAALMEY